MVKITISNKFYTKNAINDSIDAYKDVCKIELLNDNFDLEIPNTYINDFCNHVLALSKDEIYNK